MTESLYTRQSAPMWLIAFKKADSFGGLTACKGFYNDFFYDIALQMKKKEIAFQNVDLQVPSLELSSQVNNLFKSIYLKFKRENYTTTLELPEEDKKELLIKLEKKEIDAFLKVREIFAKDLASQQARAFIRSLTTKSDGIFSLYYSENFFVKEPKDLTKDELVTCLTELESKASQAFTLSIQKAASLSHLPNEIAFYKSLKCLYVENCALRTLNPLVADLPLMALDFQGNHLTRLPIELGKLHATLKKANFEDNPLREVLEKGSLEEVKAYLKEFDRDLKELTVADNFFNAVLHEYHELSNPKDTYYGWSEDHLIDDRKLLRKAIRNVLRMHLQALSVTDRNAIYGWIWVLNNKPDNGDPAFGFNKCYSNPEITKIAFSLLYHQKLAKKPTLAL